MPIIPDTTLERHITRELRNRDEETKASGNIKNALSIRTCAGRTFLGRQLKGDLCPPVGTLPHLSQACLEHLT
jgi:hypothetical protein